MTMYLAYSALKQPPYDQQQHNQQQTNHESILRYEAYQAACNKYSKEIEAIQKYLPGWMPAFR